LIAAALLMLSSACTDTPENNAGEVIKALEEEMNSAFNRYDVAALDRLWDEELTFISPSGAVANKAKRLEGLKSPPATIPVSTNESVDVTPYDDVAVAIVVSKWKGITDGKPYASTFRATHVWKKRSEGWKLVAAHVSQLKD
jgi:ketosteroid isomerase-like protein